MRKDIDDLGKDEEENEDGEEDADKIFADAESTEADETPKEEEVPADDDEEYVSSQDMFNEM